jgi:hypothetical protein
MNYPRMILAALAATMAYFIIGGLSLALAPQLAAEFRKYPAVYRGQEAMNSVIPVGMAAIFVGILVLAVLYAMVDQRGSGVAEGALFGAMQQAVAYFVEWMVGGILIGVIYQPRGAR